MTARRTIVLFHTMDPRGNKLGGIETHVRLMLSRHPDDVAVLFVGLDEIGDRTLGLPVDIEFEGRCITFLPVARVATDKINQAAKAVGQSTTLRYTLGLLRYLPVLRRLLRGRIASGEIERFEFAVVPKLLGLPFVLFVHNEGTRDDKMDSLLKRYWFVHRSAERIALTLADSVFAVNAAIARRHENLSSAFGRKTAVLTVSVDIKRFVPSPFPRDDDAFHVCFAGRLDEVKDPPLMFTTLALLDRRLAAAPVGRFRRVIFDYVGATDPNRFEEFAGIVDMTVRHGIRDAPEVAAIMRCVHAGIITSFFEGAPCYLLEMLASGRPVGAITLPQFRSLIIADHSGDLVDRRETAAASAEALATAMIGLARAIETELLSPARIAALSEPFSIERQMGQLFSCHAALARRM